MEPSIQATITRLLHAVQDGNEAALNALFPLVYEELHAQAHRQRQRWHGNHTVNTTAIVHEAYLKLVDQSQFHWNSRAHFLGVAAKAMRHILMDYAKRSRTLKRGSGVPNIPLEEAQVARAPSEGMELGDEQAAALLRLEEALKRLGEVSERQSRVVECRFFGGMTIPDTAAALGISPATVKRDWVLAQAWLYREMNLAQEAE